MAAFISLFFTFLLFYYLIVHWQEFTSELMNLSILFLILAFLIQAVVIVCRLEAWRTCLECSGHKIKRRHIYSAGALAFPLSVINLQMGMALRLILLRKIAPNSPSLATLCAAEVPIWGAEALIGGLLLLVASQALGLSLWITCIAFLLGISLAYLLSLFTHKLPTQIATHLTNGAQVIKQKEGRNKLFTFMGLVALAQVARIWVLLLAAGVNASAYQASAILTMQGILQQLPVGATSSSGASLLVFQNNAEAAAILGITLTFTEFLAGIVFLGVVTFFLVPFLMKRFSFSSLKIRQILPINYKKQLK